MRIGLTLACSAMLLQLAVLMQPIFPEQLRIALVCQSISELLIRTASHSQTHPASGAPALLSEQITRADAARGQHLDRSQLDQMQLSASQHNPHAEHAQAATYDCLYCTVYSHLFTGLDLSIKQLLGVIKVRLLSFKQRFQAVYFALQRLYLLPQGRAPPFPVCVFG